MAAGYYALTLHRTYSRLEEKIKDENWKKAGIYALQAREWKTRALLIGKSLSDKVIMKETSKEKVKD